MTVYFWQLMTRIAVMMACLLLTACGDEAPSHADTDGDAGAGADDRSEHKESDQEERPDGIIIDLDARQPLLFHRDLEALNRAFAGIEPGEPVQLALKVPRDGESRSIATQSLRVDKGQVNITSGGQSLELEASGEHSRVHAPGQRSRFRFRGTMFLMLSAASSEQGQDEQGTSPEAVLIPNNVEAIGDAGEEGVGWSELQLPLAVEVKDDHYLILMKVEKSEDFEGAIEWQMPAYK